MLDFCEASGFTRFLMNGLARELDKPTSIVSAEQSAPFVGAMADSQWS
jgi:hypothetical protein